MGKNVTYLSCGTLRLKSSEMLLLWFSTLLLYTTPLMFILFLFLLLAHDVLYL